MEYKVCKYTFIIPVDEHQKYLIYNTVSGNLDLLNWSHGIQLKEWKSSERFQVSPTTKALLDFLLEHWYVTEFSNDDIAEYHQLYREDFKKKVDDEGTVALTIGTTITCNMACPYCFEFTKPNLTLKDQKVVEEIVAYVEQIFDKAEVKEWKRLHVTWFGGEPLINPWVIRELSPRLQSISNDC